MAQAQLNLLVDEREYEMIEEGEVPTYRWTGKAFDTRYIDSTTECRMEALLSTF